ncbi:hypothetical protein Dimus_015200 [Dionaea muscipula]
MEANREIEIKRSKLTAVADLDDFTVEAWVSSSRRVLGSVTRHWWRRCRARVMTLAAGVARWILARISPITPLCSSQNPASNSSGECHNLRDKIRNLYSCPTSPPPVPRHRAQHSATAGYPSLSREIVQICHRSLWCLGFAVAAVSRCLRRGFALAALCGQSRSSVVFAIPMLVSLISGPWDALFGGGNLPAFILESLRRALTVLPPPTSNT